MAGVTNTLDNQIPGHWMPWTHGGIVQWVGQKVEAARKVTNVLSKHGPLDPALAKLQQIVVESPHLLRLANDMFTEASEKYAKHPAGGCAIKSFDEFIAVLELIIQSGPELYEKTESETAMDLIGFPINALLYRPMGPFSGYDFFLRPEGKFLGTSDSKACLDGWLSERAQELIAAKANNGTTKYTFQELSVCPDPSDEHLGFNSWEALFVRQFCAGIRPVMASDDGAPDHQFPDSTLVITNACESAPLQLRTGVKLFDTFYLKGQPYSLGNMLNCNARTAEFVGGTVYQAFLSALSYHRWHAPVSGKVVAIEYVPGTYYSENWFERIAAAEDNDKKPEPKLA